MVTTQEIPYTSWRAYLDDVSKLYRGWRASVEVQRLDIGDQVITEGAVLDGVGLERAGTGAGSILIALGHGPDEYFIHRVDRPWAVRAALLEPGAEGDIQIESEDGTVTLVQLRRPAELPPGRSASAGREPGPGAWGRAGDGGEPRAGRMGAGASAGEVEGFERPWLSRADAASARARMHEPRGAPLERRSWPPDAAGVAGVGVVGAPRAMGARQVGRAWLPARAAVGSVWALAARGIAAVVLGILAILMPGMALLTLVYLFGIYAVTDGVLNVIAAFRSSPERSARHQPRWLLAVRAVVSFGAAGFAFLTPGITALALLVVIGVWAIATGVVELVAAIRLRGHGVSGWMAGAGLISIILGGLLLLFPGAGALAMVLWIGALLVGLGVMLLAEAIALGAWRDEAGGRAVRRAA